MSTTRLVQYIPCTQDIIFLDETKDKNKIISHNVQQWT